MSEDIKPCPFCGNDAVLDRYEGHDIFHVACRSIYCGVNPVSEEMPTAEEAVALWNRRKP